MSTFDSDARSTPVEPDLESDRQQARALLVAAHAGEADAMRRLAASHPRFEGSDDPAFLGRAIAMHDAQLVVAREHGFVSWALWKEFVETRRLDRAERATALVRAACSSDVRKATRLLQTEPELACFDLFTACTCGEVAVVNQMLSAAPALSASKGGPFGFEPILYVCFSRFLRADSARRAGILQIANVLLARGADPNTHYWSESGGERWLQSALYGAAGIANNIELTTRLLDAGARLDAGDKEALYHTTEFPDSTCLRALLERGDPPVDQVKYCLGRAIDFNYPSHVALFLAAGADPNFGINWDGLRTHLHKAVYLRRSTEIIRMLIDAGGDVNSTDAHGVSILRTAIANQDSEAAALLRSHGAREEAINEADLSRPAPIALCIAAARNDVSTIDRLIDTGADPNALAAPDQTPPLHWAAWRGRLNAVQRLVKRGADIHRLNSYGGDALGTSIHGSANCFDPEGGPGMRLPEEAFAGDYTQIVEYLFAAGSKLPAGISGGSDAVQEVLRRHGVADVE